VHSILAQVADRSDADPPAGAPAELDAAERALVMRLAEWPVALGEAEERRAPHRVVAYLIELAREFHGFYHRCRVVGEPAEIEAFRLDVCRATAATIRTGLDLLGVEAPERM
jgi:arginyl-tRNA synthetase